MVLLFFIATIIYITYIKRNNVIISSRLDISHTKLKQVIYGGISGIMMKLKLILLKRCKLWND